MDDRTENAKPDEDRPRGLTWRDPVLWLVIGPPAAAVVAGLFTVWIAASHRDPLVNQTVRKVGVAWQDPAAAPTTQAPAPAGATVDGDVKPPAEAKSDDRGG